MTLNQEYVVSAGGDETIQVYSLAEKKTVHTFRHSGRVYCVSFGPARTDYANRIISCSDDGKVRFWKIENGEIEMEFQCREFHDGLYDGALYVAFDIVKNATKLVVSYFSLESSGVSVWSIEDKKVLADVKLRNGPQGGAVDVRSNSTADTIAVVSSKGNIYRHKITL